MESSRTRKKKMWIAIVVVLGALAVAIVCVLAAGAALPVEHVASVSKTVKASPEQVWSALTDIEAMPSWRKDLKSVERTEGKNGLSRWIEKSGFGDIPFQVEVSEQPSKLVTRIDDNSLPFGGKWTFELKAHGNQTELKITEEGQVHSPFFRFMSKYVFGHNKTLQTYADQLAAKFEKEAR